jgi:hypothetical protein
MLKPTPAPWKIIVHENLKEAQKDGCWEWTSNWNNKREGRPSEIYKDCGDGSHTGLPGSIEVGEINARLIVSACNSYQKHCSDPVKCAEEDLLGEALEVLQRIVKFSNLDESEQRHLNFSTLKATKGEATYMGLLMRKAQQLLAKAKGELKEVK